MKNIYFIIFLSAIIPNCFGQNSPDVIYKTDEVVISAFVDEITTSEIIYFSPQDKGKKQPKRVAKEKVWKIVYSTGETEIITAPMLKPFVIDKIYLKKGSIVEAEVTEVTLETVNYIVRGEKKKQKTPRKDINKIMYSDGHEDTFEEAEPEYNRKEKEEIVQASVTEHDKEDTEQKALPDKKQTGKSSERSLKKIKEQPAVSEIPQQEQGSATSPAKPNELVIKIQHEAMPSAGYGDADRGQTKKYKNYVGLRFGGLMTSFYRDEVAMPEKPLYNWEAGLGFSLVNRKHYNARVEFMYANKGASEVFSDNGFEITTRNKLTYIQGNLLPLILKTGAKKINPVIGGGGYYSYLFKHTSQFKEDDGDFEDDELTKELFENKFDYGLCAMLGFYNGSKPLLEFRYEYGLGKIMKGLDVKNHGLSVSLFLAF